MKKYFIPADQKDNLSDLEQGFEFENIDELEELATSVKNEPFDGCIEITKKQADLIKKEAEQEGAI